MADGTWHAPMKSNGVYWIGADGNVYVKGGSGTNSAGRADANTNQYWQSRGFGLIADPNPPKPGAQAAAGSDGGGGGYGGGDGGGGVVYADSGYSAPAAPPKPDKSNDIALNNAGLSAVDSQLSTGLSSIDAALAKIRGQYDIESTANEKLYGDQVVTNTNNLQKNKQTAYVNAAQGRQGLFGTLASLGALNGDGISLANNAVKKGANDDLAGANDNFATNAQSLDTAIGTFRREDKMRRENADTAAENARLNARSEAARSKMTFLSNLSNDHAEMGNSGEAKRFADMAAALYPEMARTTIPNANIGYTGAAFTPGTLAEYMAGTDSQVVNSTPVQGGMGIPGLIVSSTRKKQQQTAA
jgi:hypothetical protein